jgi:hypothetical protein
LDWMFPIRRYKSFEIFVNSYVLIIPVVTIGQSPLPAFYRVLLRPMKIYRLHPVPSYYEYMLLLALGNC